MLNFQIVPDPMPPAVVPAPTPEPEVNRNRITQMAFDLRLTSEERKAIRAAAAANADVDDAYRIKEKATFIDLTDEITRTLLMVMVQANCIALERVDIILGTPAEDREIYRGPA